MVKRGFSFWRREAEGMGRQLPPSMLHIIPVLLEQFLEAGTVAEGGGELIEEEHLTSFSWS